MKAATFQMAYESMVLWAIDRWRAVVAFFILAALGAVAVMGFILYQNNCEYRAHQAYVEFRTVVDTRPAKEALSLQKFHEAIVEKGTSFLNQHGSSACANAVRGTMAQSLSILGDVAGAQKFYQEAASAEKNPDIKGLFEISAILAALDAGIDKMGAVARLKQFVADDSSAVYDLALYRLGEYYWSAGDYAEARLWWGQLLAAFETKRSDLDDEESTWIVAAREKMALIDYR